MKEVKPFDKGTHQNNTIHQKRRKLKTIDKDSHQNDNINQKKKKNEAKND
jgi:hypothetical protein